jgi:xylulokinase
MKLFLGLDVSTTGAKALLIDEKGSVVSSATAPLTLSTPHPLWSEQDPHEWWIGIAKSIRQVLELANMPGSAVTAIGLTGQMHGLVLLDEQGEVLRPAILWNDQRTGAQCDEIRARLGRGPDPDYWKRCSDWFYRPQNPLGATERTGIICQGAAYPAAQRLRPLPADR